ncbi:hypothetical protein KIPB_010720, partial [Kipferlia bialata]|eukprot:g10720.t1
MIRDISTTYPSLALPYASSVCCT